MGEMGIDGLFISGEENMFYFTGIRFFTPWTSYPRPSFAALPREGEPILLVQENHLTHGRLASWVKDVRDYPELNGPPAETVAGIIEDAGLKGRRIGAEIGYEQRINMPVETFLRVQRIIGVDFGCLFSNLEDADGEVKGGIGVRA